MLPKRSAMIRSVSLLFMSLISIPFNEFLAKCRKRATEKSTDRSRIQIECRGQFFVCEAVATQQEQLGLARLNDAQDQTNLLLFLLRCERLFDRRSALPRKSHEREQVLVSVAARRSPKIVQGHSDGCPVQPALRAFMLHRGRSLPLQKYLD